MKKLRVKLFWSYDVIKTQNWLNKQANLGYKLIRFIPFLRMFVFKKSIEEKKPYLIIYEKGSNGCPSIFTKNSEYKEVLHTKNYYILQQINPLPEKTPSYESLLNKNAKIKYIVGIILLFVVFIYFTLFTAVLSSILSGSFSIEWGGGIHQVLH